MQKGGNLTLSGATVRASLRWTGGAGVPDVDASALVLQSTGKVGGDTDFVFYNQPQHPSGGVRLVGKVAGPPAADQIDIDLARLPAGAERVVLAASATGGTFGQVPGLELVLSEVATGAAVAVFAMTADAETAFVCAELYRRNGAWKFRAVGQGYASGLAGLAGDFGIQTGEAPAPAPPAPATPAPAPAPAAPAPAPAAPPPPAPAPSPAAPPPPVAPAPSLDLAAPAPAAPVAPRAAAPAAPVRADGALDLDAPWPPR